MVAGRLSPEWRRESWFHGLLRDTEMSQVGTDIFVCSPHSMVSAHRWHSWPMRSVFSIRAVTALARCRSQPVPG